MIAKAFRNIISISRWSLIALSIFPVSTANADGRITVTEPTDYWVTFDVPTQFLAITYQSDTFPSDPQLWLYTEDGVLLVTNDDFVGLQSRIEIEVPAGQYRLRASTCCYEPDVWRDGVVWNIQYELSYNGLQSNSPTTTIPETTTTVPETTTTWPETTTSTEPTTTSTTTAPTTTVPVTEVPPTVETTTTTTSTTSLPPETTSTTVADTVAPSTTPTTNPSVTTVEPPQTSLTPMTTLPNTTTTSLDPIPTETTSIPDTEPPTTNTEPPSVVIPDDPTPEEINELAEELVSSIDELSDEEITDLVESIDVSELTEESISAVFSEEVLNELSDDQVTELIDAIVPSELSDDQALALSEALTDAPDNVKQEFEQQLDVFGGQFDTYVPTGSAVPVGARRVIVAAAVAAFAMPAPSSSSRKQ